MNFVPNFMFMMYIGKKVQKVNTRRETVSDIFEGAKKNHAISSQVLGER
jgi:hypothetical protein